MQKNNGRSAARANLSERTSKSSPKQKGQSVIQFTGKPQIPGVPKEIREKFNLQQLRVSHTVLSAEKGKISLSSKIFTFLSKRELNDIPPILIIPKTFFIVVRH